MITEEKKCSRCILDSNLPGIEFDEKGECNYCKLFEDLEKEYPLGKEGEKNLQALITKIKAAGEGQKYDCVVGVSGGTDSTYVLYEAVKLGLRPLAVHFDNGWNSEIAVNNIQQACQTLGVDLFTYVVDWEEFKNLQLSFLKASTPDLEIPTDLGIVSILYRVAAQHGITNILNGVNFRTEGNMPFGWVYADGKYIKSVHKKFGSVPLKTFPNLTLLDIFYYTMVKRIKVVRFLNYFSYSKTAAREVLERNVGWKYYGGHHFESIYTRFFQGYISPEKFKMERRVISLSAQVRSGLLDRQNALEMIRENHYPEGQAKHDKEYIAKKFDLSIEEFEKLLAYEPKRFLDYPTYYPLLRKLKGVIKIAARLKIIPVVYHDKKYSL